MRFLLSVLLILTYTRSATQDLRWITKTCAALWSWKVAEGDGFAEGSRKLLLNQNTEHTGHSFCMQKHHQEENYFAEAKRFAEGSRNLGCVRGCVRDPKLKDVLGHRKDSRKRFAEGVVCHKD